MMSVRRGSMVLLLTVAVATGAAALLQDVVMMNDAEAARVMLADGADVNARDHGGRRTSRRNWGARRCRLLLSTADGPPRWS